MKPSVKKQKKKEGKNMTDMDPKTLVTIVTIIVAGSGIVLGTAIPALAEIGRAHV